MSKPRCFCWRLIALILILAICSASNGHASPHAERQRAARLLVELERIHADAAGAKERAEQAQRVGLEYARNCAETAEICQDDLLLALSERGYPEASFRNFRQFLTEAKKIVEAPNQSEQQARGYRAALEEYPIAIAAGEAFDPAAGAFLAGLVGGVTLFILGIRKNRPLLIIIGIGIIFTSAGFAGGGSTD